MKDSEATDIESAIKSAVAGENLVSPAILKNMMKIISNNSITTSASPFPEPDPLTQRQREILRLISEGKTTKAVALELNISPKTVEAHRTQLMERLGISNIPDLVRYAMKRGLLPSEVREFLPTAKSSLHTMDSHEPPPLPATADPS